MSQLWAGTIVRVSTTLGDYSIELLDEMAPATVQWGLCNVDGRDCATPVRKLRCQVAVIATNVRNEAVRPRAVRERSLRELEAVCEAGAEQRGCWRCSE